MANSNQDAIPKPNMSFKLEASEENPPNKSSDEEVASLNKGQGVGASHVTNREEKSIAAVATAFKKEDGGEVSLPPGFSHAHRLIWANTNEQVAGLDRGQVMGTSHTTDCKEKSTTAVATTLKKEDGRDVPPPPGFTHAHRLIWAKTNEQVAGLDKGQVMGASHTTDCKEKSTATAARALKIEDERDVSPPPGFTRAHRLIWAKIAEQVAGLDKGKVVGASYVTDCKEKSAAAVAIALKKEDGRDVSPPPGFARAHRLIWAKTNEGEKKEAQLWRGLSKLDHPSGSLPLGLSGWGDAKSRRTSRSIPIFSYHISF